MATLSTASLNWLADEWEKSYKTAVLSGIVGDLAHKARGGYHISREDQSKSNYSVIRADDKPGNGPNDRAAAIDMTMSTADIKSCHVRLRESWKNRANDPRWKYINAWNGWDGTGSAGRYDVITGNVSTATADHKWHIHLEIRRKYVNDMTAMRAILSLLRGEPYKTSPTTPATGDDDMPTAEEIAKAVWNYPMARPEKPTESISAGTYQRYNDVVNNTAADKVINTLRPLILQDNVDEAAIADAILANTAFVDNLATAVAAKLPTGVEISPEELATAFKTALREGVAAD